MTDNTRKHKHLTFDDRLAIQEGLTKCLSFKAIARELSKDPTTISKEVKLHAKEYKNGFVSNLNEICPKLLNAPYVCNGCSKRSNAGCRYLRRLYNARFAQEEYEQNLTVSREGIPLNKAEFYQISSLITDGVKAGQHIYHIVKTHNLPVSVATVYRHIGKGYHGICKLDLPRAVKFKPRHTKRTEYVPHRLKIGREYKVFGVQVNECDSWIC